MSQRVSIGVYLLVLALLVMGLAGCDRSAEVREPEPVDVGETPATMEPIPGADTTPVPGETVVSAVTPAGGTPSAPGATPGTTVVAVNDTPAAPQPQATAGPAPTADTSGQGAPAPAVGDVIHTVQPGETLSSIARRYGTSWQAIAQANGLVNPNQIYAGQKLTIKTSSSGSTSGGTTGCRIRHTVKQGEWVWQIARQYGASPYDILAANGLSIQTANTIYPGAVLCIP